MKTFFLSIVLLLVAVPAYADIVLAVAGPFTGEVAMWGVPAQGGALQSVADINATGGIRGQKIVVKTYDDACDPKQAVTVANKIISDNIHFVLHGTCSAASLAALKTYIEEGTVVINPFASNPKITDEGGPHMFRTMSRDDQAGSVIADYIVKQEAGKKLAILNDKSAYGLGIAQYVKGAYNKAGMKEVAFESYDPANHDYSALIAHLKELGTEAVFIGGYPIEAAMITRQLRDAGSRAFLE